MSFSVKGKHVVVAGGGRSGIAAAELLASRGARVTLSDIHDVPESAALRATGVTIDVGRIGRPCSRRLISSCSVRACPSNRMRWRLRTRGCSCDRRNRDGVAVAGRRVIAITGTKGKSTTTTLTARMLTEAGLDATAGGNLGVALSTQVSSTHPGALHVVEVSSFQLKRPTPSTLDRGAGESVAGPSRSPRHVRGATRQPRRGFFPIRHRTTGRAVNADDPASMALAGGCRARRLDFALDAMLRDGVTVEANTIVRRHQGRSSPLMPLTSVKLPGRHLLGDVLAAAAVGCVRACLPQPCNAPWKDSAACRTPSST